MIGVKKNIIDYRIIDHWRVSRDSQSGKGNFDL